MHDIAGKPSTWGGPTEASNRTRSHFIVPMRSSQIAGPSFPNLVDDDAGSTVRGRDRGQSLESPHGTTTRVLRSAPSNLADSESPGMNASALASLELSEEEEQTYSNLSTLSDLSTRTSVWQELALNIAAVPLFSHRKFWALLEESTAPNSHSQLRAAQLLYLEAIADLPGLTSDDLLRLLTFIQRPVEADLIYQQVAALETLLLKHKGQPEVLRHGFARYIISTLPRQYENVAKSRKRRKYQGAEPQTLEMRGLDALFAFFLDFVSVGAEFISEEMALDLVNEVLCLAGVMNFVKDLRAALEILVALAKLGRIPAVHMKPCLEMLCGVLFVKKDLAVLAQQGLGQLCRRGTDGNVVEILLDIVEQAPPEKEQKRVRGALQVLTNLYLEGDAENVPQVSFREVMHSLNKVYLLCECYQYDSLQLLQRLFCDAKSRLLLEEDWKDLFKVLTGAITKPPQGFDSSHTTALKLPSTNTQLNDWNKYRDQQSTIIASALDSLYTQVKADKQELIQEFALMATSPLSETIFQGLIDTFLSDVPSAAGANEPRALVNYVADQDNDSEKRALILERLCAALPDRPNGAQQRRLRHLIFKLMSSLSSEHNIRLLNAIAAVATTFARMAGLEDVEKVARNLIAFADLHDTHRAPSEPTMVELPNNTVTVSLVGLFLYHMTHSAEKAVSVYNVLVDLADNTQCPPSARLTAMKLLTRLRSTATKSVASTSVTESGTNLTQAGTSSSPTSSVLRPPLPNAVMVVAVPDNLGLAECLSRTEATAFSIRLTFNKADYEANVEQPSSRASRASRISSPAASRSETRSTSGRLHRTTPPLWMYPGRKGLPEDPPIAPSKVLRLGTSELDPKITLRVNLWLETMIKILQQPGDWEIYSYILVHLPSQLSNPSLFADSLVQIRHLRSVIVSQLQEGTFHEPPSKSGAKKGDVALCLVHSLIMLIAYCNFFSTNEQEVMVKVFLLSQGQFDRAAKTCIQAMTICCYELPRAITRSLDDILQKMAQMITKAHLAMDVLEFLGCLAALPGLHANLSEKQIRAVFVICITHLEHSREQRDKLQRASTPTVSNPNHNRQSAISLGSDSSQNIDVHKDFPQYIYALAYHVMTFWFLSIELVDRPKHVGWITSRLSSTDAEGNNVMEEQSQVLLDMMHRTTYLDLGETRADPQFRSSDGQVLRKSWIVGLSIVTVETAIGTGFSQIIKRQASGTTYASYYPHTAPLPVHHVPVQGYTDRANIFPSHIFMQLHSTIAPTPAPMEPICLPDNEIVQRAISAFDRNDTVDGYKAGVIYVGNGQSSEAEILANTNHSRGFDTLLKGLGTKVKLQGAKFNTQGLDRGSNSDGEHTYAWRNRVVEIVFHVPSMMPTNQENDPQCNLKKSHIGNDHVNIIYNESGLPFDFNTFPSQFNYVYIVVTPDGLFAPEPKPEAKLETIHENDRSSGSLSTGTQRHSRQGSTTNVVPTKPSPASTPEPTPKALPRLSPTFTVQTLHNPSLPPLSLAHNAKSITLSSLGPLVRQMALNAAVFSHAWAARDRGEHISSWRNRLQEIHRLRQRYPQSRNVSAGVVPTTGGEKAKGGEGVAGASERSKSAFSGLFGSRSKDREEGPSEPQFQGIRAEKSYTEGDKWHGEVRMGGLAEEEGVKAGLDFSRWAGENPKLPETRRSLGENFHGGSGE